jgi:uncharacterized protein (TIGR02246 family)
MLSRTVLRVVAATALLSFVWALPAPVGWPGLRPVRAQAVTKKAAQPRPQPPPPPQPAGADPRAQDAAAVRAAMQAFVKAFEARDAKAVAACWTAGGEFRNLDGVVVSGRDTLEKGLTALFARTPEVAAGIRPEPVRFLSNDVAVEEGTATVRRGRVEPAGPTRYRALLVRDGGRWLLAELHESPGPAPSIADLAWLVGEWKSLSGQGAEIRTTYTWAPNQKFLQARFTLQEKNLSLTGIQVIGVDPATGALHTWTFEADGGVGEADWSRDGGHWVLNAAGTSTDGRELTETNILTRINDDTFTWQSIDRMLDESELPDLAPVKVTRIKAEK